MVRYQPVGVVGAFAAWNFPIALLARKVAPALAAGCSVICRPSQETPGSIMALVNCCKDAGVPAGVVGLLTGKASDITPTLMASPVVRKISLTGSAAVGKQMVKAAADTLKRVTMELGGHAPVIVFDDADIAAVAELSAQVKFRNAGQVCVSPNRYFIHESKLADFTDRFVAVAKSFKIGDGMAPGVDIGPLATKKRLDEIEKLVADTRAEGAELVCGGRRAAGRHRRAFFRPTG